MGAHDSPSIGLTGSSLSLQLPRVKVRSQRVVTAAGEGEDDD